MQLNASRRSGYLTVGLHVQLKWFGCNDLTGLALISAELASLAADAALSFLAPTVLTKQISNNPQCISQALLITKPCEISLSLGDGRQSITNARGLGIYPTSTRRG